MRSNKEITGYVTFFGMLDSNWNVTRYFTQVTARQRRKSWYDFTE